MDWIVAGAMAVIAIYLFVGSLLIPNDPFEREDDDD